MLLKIQAKFLQKSVKEFIFSSVKGLYFASLLKNIVNPSQLLRLLVTQKALQLPLFLSFSLSFSSLSLDRPTEVFFL